MFTALLVLLAISILLTFVAVMEYNIWKKHYKEIPTSGHRRRYNKWYMRCVWLIICTMTLFALTMVAVLFTYVQPLHYPLPL